MALNQSQLPTHTHVANAVALLRGQLATNVPTATSALTVAQDNIYTDGAPNVPMAANSVTPQGGGGAHNNMQPFLALNYSICLSGNYPSFD